MEVAKAADKASDPRIAEMRLKWWLGVIDNLEKKNPPEHPIADALCDALHSAHLDPDLLRLVIDWRIKDLYTKQPNNVADLEHVRVLHACRESFRSRASFPPN